MQPSLPAQRVSQLIEDIWLGFEKYGPDYSRFPLTNQQHALMAYIVREPSITPKQLASRLGVSKSAVSQQLSKLVEEGYVLLQKSKIDKRVALLQLTTRGIEYQQLVEDYEQWINEVYYAKLSQEELVDIEISLRKLRDVWT